MPCEVFFFFASAETDVRAQGRRRRRALRPCSCTSARDRTARGASRYCSVGFSALHRDGDSSECALAFCTARSWSERVAMLLTLGLLRAWSFLHFTQNTEQIIFALLFHTASFSQTAMHVFAML